MLCGIMAAMDALVPSNQHLTTGQRLLYASTSMFDPYDGWRHQATVIFSKDLHTTILIVLLTILTTGRAICGARWLVSHPFRSMFTRSSQQSIPFNELPPARKCWYLYILIQLFISVILCFLSLSSCVYHTTTTTTNVSTNVSKYYLRSILKLNLNALPYYGSGAQVCSLPNWFHRAEPHFEMKPVPRPGSDHNSFGNANSTKRKRQPNTRARNTYKPQW